MRIEEPYLLTEEWRYYFAGRDMAEHIPPKRTDFFDTRGGAEAGMVYRAALSGREPVSCRCIRSRTSEYAWEKIMKPDERTYYAHKRLREQDGKHYYFYASPNEWWVKLHGSEDPTVTVRIRERKPEDPPSNYWGWLSFRKEEDTSKYLFVWPSEVQIDMCFPYGPKAEEARGHGRKVNLIVEEIEP